MKLDKIITTLFFLLLSLSRANEVTFIEKQEDFNHPEKVAKTGGFSLGDKEDAIVVSFEGNTLIVSTFDGAVLFERKEYMVTDVHRSKKVTVLSLYRGNANAFSFYGFLVCSESEIGTSSRIVFTSPKSEDHVQGDKVFYVLDTSGGLNYPHKEVLLKVHDASLEEDNNSTWKATVNLEGQKDARPKRK